MRIRKLWVVSLLGILGLFIGAMAALNYREFGENEDYGKTLSDAGGGQNKQVPSLTSLSDTNALEFERTFVEGHPFAATLIVETMADGGGNANKTVSLIYRDAQGRTRRDLMPGDGSTDTTPRFTTINDPVAGFTYVLDYRAHVARRTILPANRELNAKARALDNFAPPAERANSSQILPVPTTIGTKAEIATQ